VPEPKSQLQPPAPSPRQGPRLPASAARAGWDGMGWGGMGRDGVGWGGMHQRMQHPPVQPQEQPSSTACGHPVPKPTSTILLFAFHKPSRFSGPDPAPYEHPDSEKLLPGQYCSARRRNAPRAGSGCLQPGRCPGPAPGGWSGPVSAGPSRRVVWKDEVTLLGARAPLGRNTNETMCFV